MLDIAAPPRPRASVDLPSQAGSAVSAAAVSARIVSGLRVTARAWDAFSALCPSASFVGALHYARMLAIGGRLVTVEILCRENGRERKIGQASVLCTRRQRHLVDGLKLLAGCEDLWAASMQALLAALGPGRYRYGSHWSAEPPRAAAIAALPRTVVESVRPLQVHVIDFSRWHDWAHYAAGLNSNVRRSLKKASALPGLRVEVARGWRAATSVFALDTMRRTTLRRKGLSEHPGLRMRPATALRFLVRLAALGNGVVVAIARDARGARAAFSGVQFGADTFYIEGASTGENDGSSWHLLMAMIERSYRQNPAGRFVMGHEDDTNRDGPGWANLIRSRLQCQAEAMPSDEVVFRYG